MDGIFISYRRADTTEISRELYDRLTARLGTDRVFRDLDAIPAGADFEQRIRAALRTCKAMIVLIGPHWLDIKDEAGKRRLDEPDDFVRIEVTSALQRNLKVFPVLVSGAKMPNPDQLPGPLVRLARCNALEIREGSHHGQDLDRVVETVARIPDIVPPLAISAMRREMDQALADELVAVEKKTRSRYSGYNAENGELIGIVEGMHLYRFTLNDLWEPQEDTPLQVKLSGNRNIPATIVTVSSSQITISVGDQLSEQELKHVRLVDDPSRLIEGLRTALSETDETVAFLGAKTFGLIPPMSGRRSPLARETHYTRSDFPDESQDEAMRAALGSEVCYVIGPPGSGKTQTLAAIAYHFLTEGRSVLIAAHTNIAIDNAVLVLADLCSKNSRPELAEGRIVRYGAPKLDKVRQHANIYPPEIAKRKGDELGQQKQRLEAMMQEYVTALDHGTAQETTAATNWQTTRESLRLALVTARSELQQLQQQEAERKRLLESQLTAILSNLDNRERQRARMKDRLARLAGERAKIQVEWEQLIIAEKVADERLRKAIQAHPVVRLLTGANVGRLQHQLAEIQYRNHICQDRVNVCERQRSDTQRELDAVEQILQDVRRQRAETEAALGQETPEAKRIVELTAAVDQYEVRIRSGDEARSKQKRAWEAQRGQLQRSVQEVKRQIADVNVELLNMEKQIVENALVVATTLTKTYTGSATRSRRFDAVIIDEASMAPMPAVYVVASRANESVTIVGDPCQLSPVGHAETPMAKKWLKTDIFTHTNMTLERVIDAERPDDQTMAPRLLAKQYRMHPSISIIPRRHVYRGRLEDGIRDPRTCPIEPAPSSPLVLCDTSNAGPRTTKPPSNSSRLNEHHALYTVRLAKIALSSLGDAPPNSKGEPRIGIVTPYRAHARRVLHLIRQQDDLVLRREVQVGTIHRFQGLEFDVVIFDTVESPPMNPFDFTTGGYGSEAMRLVNVAITRPKHKLIIVANDKYLHVKLGASATLRLALDEARKAATIECNDLVGNDKCNGATPPGGRISLMT